MLPCVDSFTMFSEAAAMMNVTAATIAEVFLDMQWGPGARGEGSQRPALEDDSEHRSTLAGLSAVHH